MTSHVIENVKIVMPTCIPDGVSFNEFYEFLSTDKRFNNLMDTNRFLVQVFRGYNSSNEYDTFMNIDYTFLFGILRQINKENNTISIQLIDTPITREITKLVDVGHDLVAIPRLITNNKTIKYFVTFDIKVIERNDGDVSHGE